MSKHTPRKAFAPAPGASDPAHPAGAPMAPPATAESANALAVPQDDDADALPPIDYDPAEYRWVPVRRRARFDGWTEEKQRRFIETLADTGLVNVACRAVGMSRAAAYALRRAPDGAAFASAWDLARQHAGCLIEDIAFERAIEGTEQEILNSIGEVTGTRLVHDNGLLKWLLSHLKRERYGNGPRPGAAVPDAAPPALQECLRAMEPVLPAPAEQLLDPDTLADELELAEVADGKLPHFLNEQRPVKTDAQLAAEAAAARLARGAAASAKVDARQELTRDEFADLCHYLDPVSNPHPQPRRRQGTPVSS